MSGTDGTDSGDGASSTGGTGGVPGAVDGRCPRCGARVAAGQEWCSLCLEPLVGPAARDQAPPPASEGDVLDGTDDLVEPTGPTGPVEPSPPATPPVAGPGPSPYAADAMLAELAAASAADRPLSRGPLAGRSRAVRGLLGCGAAAVLVAVLLLVTTLVGLL
ncbi:hypothetical protein [Aquipuribacter hungaricus]|uniref:Zinc ribbon domain-containing protein n=1 Tax=Aquipuribacter hungaricus TaxID=545624 RepID=A0ABV7WG66_9MICO